VRSMLTIDRAEASMVGESVAAAARSVHKENRRQGPRRPGSFATRPARLQSFVSVGRRIPNMVVGRRQRV